jgi:hypothetical protein
MCGVVDDFLKLKRDDIHVSFCRMEHPVETYAIRLQDGDAVFVYSGDSVYTEKLAEFAKGADVLLIDSGFMGPPDPEKKTPAYDGDRGGRNCPPGRGKAVVFDAHQPKLQ